MRLLVIVLFAMGIDFTAAAQTNAAAAQTNAAAALPPAAPSPASSAADAANAKLTEPLSTTTADNTRYMNDPNLITDCTSRVAAFDERPCDLVFIGDSITARWLGPGKAIWDSTYTPYHALDFGVEGDKTQNVLWRLSNMSIQNLKPKVAVILIGTNNTMNSPHEIANGIKAVLANTQEVFSGVKIILVSILPNTRAENKMKQVNALIKGDADDESVFYLDLVPLMPEVTTTEPNGRLDTGWKGIGPDGLHPDAIGYQIWADAMAPLLAKLMSGN